MQRKIWISALTILLAINVNAQKLKGELSGRVMDAETELPIPFASIQVLGDSLKKITQSDPDGIFKFVDLPVGRYEVVVSTIGYGTGEWSAIEISSARVATMSCSLKPSITELESAEIVSHEPKNEALNKMATVSSTQISMEEARRFAGGYDDPARLVSSYAGVSSDGVGNNGIAIRGNAPKGLLWRLEGMPIYNPNHFGEVAGFGAGGITALSSQVIDNSDFFTGAFPAEYGNATSGVFDLNMRSGNTEKHQHTFQAGVIGLDVASEGPLSPKNKSSYLFNYRYSTFGLIRPILPDEAGIIAYQDLAFKINNPIGEKGILQFWGFGLSDYQSSKPEQDTTLWEYNYHMEGAENRISSGVLGLSYKQYIGEKSYWKNTVAASGNQLKSENYVMDYALEKHPESDIDFRRMQYSWNSVFNSRLNSKTTLRAGLNASVLGFDLQMDGIANDPDVLVDLVDEKGQKALLNGFVQASIQLNEKWKILPGFHTLYSGVNDEFIPEPRIAAEWKFHNKQKLALAYGKHSQLEKLNFYLEKIPNTNGDLEQLNKDIKLAKSHHLVLSYDWVPNERMHFKIEPYVQFLYDVPVIADSSFSFLNLEFDWFIRHQLENTGEGRNIGVDLTFERYLHKGWFFMSTVSIFDSRYKGGEGIWRSTRYDQDYIFNILFGKEWTVGADGNKFLQASVKYTGIGGRRFNPVLENASLEAGEILEDYSRAFVDQAPMRNMVHVSASLKINHEKYTGTWSLQVLNALGSPEYYGSRYNLLNASIESDKEVLVIPNLAYKIEF